MYHSQNPCMTTAAWCRWLPASKEGMHAELSSNDRSVLSRGASSACKHSCMQASVSSMQGLVGCNVCCWMAFNWHRTRSSRRPLDPPGRWPPLARLQIVQQLGQFQELPQQCWVLVPQSGAHLLLHLGLPPPCCWQHCAQMHVQPFAPQRAGDRLQLSPQAVLVRLRISNAASSFPGNLLMEHVVAWQDHFQVHRSEDAAPGAALCRGVPCRSA